MRALLAELAAMPPGQKCVVFSQWTSMIDIIEVRETVCVDLRCITSVSGDPAKGTDYAHAPGWIDESAA